MISIVLAATLMLADVTPAVATAPAAATPASDTQVAAVKTPKVNRDGLICHSEEVIGSRIPKKVCFTPAEAEDRARQDQQNLNHMQQNNGKIAN